MKKTKKTRRASFEQIQQLFDRYVATRFDQSQQLQRVLNYQEKIIAVTSIKLNISGKEIEVTPEDARRLKAVLDDLFREREKVTFVPYTPTPSPIEPYTHPWKINYANLAHDAIKYLKE